MSSPQAPALRVGVVGTGALGQHHARILADLPGARLVGVYDPRADVAQEIAGRHGTRAYDSLDALAREIDAAVVAAPTTAHAEIGCELLGRGIHVLVEKPIASSLGEADRLLAARGDRVLAVGHIEFHNPAVQALLATAPQPRFVEVQRLGVFSPRSLDVDVVLDLMIHDLHILHALDPSPVAEVRATGIDVLSPKVDICNARVALASGCVATLTASRVSAERVRKLRVFGNRRYHSVDYRDQEIHGYRLEGEGAARQIVKDDLAVEKAEPLRRELEAFVGRCRGEATRVVPGEEGRRALATALEVVAAIAAGR